MLPDFVIDARPPKINGVREVICDFCNGNINSIEKGKEHTAGVKAFLFGGWLICEDCYKEGKMKSKPDKVYDEGFDFRNEPWY